MVAAAFPPEAADRVAAMYAGLRAAARRFGVKIVGGETSRTPGPIGLTVTVAGAVEKAAALRRSGGRPGDALFVTGKLGGSIGGRHLRFTPRLAEGRWLALHARPSAMMDLSDGLAADLPRLARASRCGYRLEPGALPRHRGVTPAGAAADGEDYELLAAVPARRAAAVQRAFAAAFPRTPFTRIGQLAPAGCAEPAFDVPGYDHFA
jgi:thiamine-monophosphate kinase